MPEQDTNVRCTECGRTQTVNFAVCLRSGWPKCCGYTMYMDNTKADIKDAVRQAI